MIRRIIASFFALLTLTGSALAYEWSAEDLQQCAMLFAESMNEYATHAADVVNVEVVEEYIERSSGNNGYVNILVRAEEGVIGDGVANIPGLGSMQLITLTFSTTHRHLATIRALDRYDKVTVRYTTLDHPFSDAGLITDYLTIEKQP